MLLTMPTGLGLNELHKSKQKTKSGDYLWHTTTEEIPIHCHCEQDYYIFCLNLFINCWKRCVLGYATIKKIMPGGRHFLIPHKAETEGQQPSSLLRLRILSCVFEKYTQHKQSKHHSLINFCLFFHDSLPQEKQTRTGSHCLATCLFSPLSAPLSTCSCYQHKHGTCLTVPLQGPTQIHQNYRLTLVKSSSYYKIVQRTEHDSLQWRWESCC